MANPRLRKELRETVRGLHAAGAIDLKKLQEFETFRVVQAPAPFVPPSAPLPPNCVVSVVLHPGERVEWMRTTDANGARYVSGYTIVRPRRRAKDKPLTWKDFAPIARLGTTSFVLMKSEIAKWAQLVKQAGIEPE